LTATGHADQASEGKISLSWSMLALAGGGVRRGKVYGASDKIGGHPKDGRVQPQDLTTPIICTAGTMRTHDESASLVFCRVPEADAAVVNGGGEVLAVGREGKPVHSLR